MCTVPLMPSSVTVNRKIFIPSSLIEVLRAPLVVDGNDNVLNL
jgi:hypothetical protein